MKTSQFFPGNFFLHFNIYKKIQFVLLLFFSLTLWYCFFVFFASFFIIFRDSGCVTVYHVLEPMLLRDVDASIQNTNVCIWNYIKMYKNKTVKENLKLEINCNNVKTQEMEKKKLYLLVHLILNKGFFPI